MRKGIRLHFAGLCIVLGCPQNSDTKVLIVEEIDSNGVLTLQQVSNLLEANTALQRIDVLNWKAFPYQPEVSFRKPGI